ncbi:MAG: hypothetical protein AMJ88_14005 [Anaerolineae bacterium SM23_ 63]|nr:MAG: hypothetical protein AMJ88_14005 [Anaerolineae bacterium SM23_ 63]
MEERQGFQYRSLFWPILLIGVGVVWLLGNLGYIPTPSLRMLSRLWPLILIVIGLDIIFGRRSPVIGGLIGLGTVALVIALLLFAPSLGLEALQTDGELKTLTFSEPIGSATSARITLDLERYPTTIEALPASDLLIDAELDTFTDVNFSARGTREKSVSLDPVTDFSFDFDWTDWDTAGTRWEIGLSPDVPIDLTVDVGSGSATIDLIYLEISELEIDGGSGSVNLILPESSSLYNANIDGGSGSFDIEFESGAEVRAEMSVGSGSFDVVIGSSADVEARIDGGSGSIDIDVPGDVGVRVVVRDRGSGSVHVPGNYLLVDDMGDNDGDTGIWETDGYNSAVHRVEITFDPGSGSFNLR